MSVESMVLTAVENTGTTIEKVVLAGGRIQYNIAGKAYILRDAADEFLDGGWDQNYHDVCL